MFPLVLCCQRRAANEHHESGVELEDVQIDLAAFGVHTLEISAVFDEPGKISDHLIE